MGGAVSVFDLESERNKPLDASDLNPEEAKAEVIRLRKLLHEHINGGVKPLNINAEFEKMYQEPSKRPTTALKRSNSHGDVKQLGIASGNRPGSGEGRRSTQNFGVETATEQATFSVGGNCKLIISIGDIASWQGDAIVNAANESLLRGGGVDHALHEAAGPDLHTACEALPSEGGVRCPVGQARMTPGFLLKCQHVIHVVGPRYVSPAVSDGLLASAYRSALDLANSSEVQPPIQSIAFPSISTGAFGYPSNEAAKIAIESLKDAFGGLLKIDFILHSKAMYQIYTNEAAKLLGPPLAPSLVASRRT